MNNKANPSLTNQECDAILHRTHRDVQLDGFSVCEIDFAMYRSSQNDNYTQAKDRGAVRHIGNILGLVQAEAVFYSLETAVEMMEYQSSYADVRVVIRLDGVELPECFLADAMLEIHRHMVRQGWYFVS